MSHRRGTKNLRLPFKLDHYHYGVKGGALKLLVYQVGGQSTSVVRGWKLLDVVKIQDLAVLERTFPGTRSRPAQHHMQWDDVFVRVGE